jgi:hypothetical protein
LNDEKQISIFKDVDGASRGSLYGKVPEFVLADRGNAQKPSVATVDLAEIWTRDLANTKQLKQLY